MKNCEKYKTADERAKAFEKFCNIHDKCDCTECPLSEIKPDCGDSRGQFAWLELEAEEEEEKILPCPICGSPCVVVFNAVECTNKAGCAYRCWQKGFGAAENVAAHNRIAKAVMESGNEGDK